MYLSRALLLASVVLTACAEPEKKPQNTIPPTVQAAGPAITDKFKTLSGFPFLADTTLFFRLDACDSLGAAEVKALGANWFRHDLVSNIGWELSEFYTIDSIKAAGKYDAYCDSLDIGQTKRSNAYALGRLQPDTNTTILVWALTASSYEACPYSSSQCVYFTVINRGSVGESFRLGEYVSAGDPPVSMERIVSGRLNSDLTFELAVFAENDEDMDQPEVEVTRELYRFAIRDGRIVMLSEQKEAPRKVRRKVAA